MEQHKSNPVPEDKTADYNARPAAFWNKFYSHHADQFFKDRRWLPLEFPELVACCEPEAGPKTVLEVGCGAGNTVFPLLMHNENPDLRLVATDYSSTAVNVVKRGELYPKAPHGIGEIRAAVWDITSKPDPESGVDYSLPEGVEPGSIDVLTVIYVLSALHPKEWEQAMHNLYTALKPGGLLCVRDYGRHDLAQLRIKKERLLDVENFYIRGDGTRVYFFEKEQLGGLMTAPPRGEAEDKHMFEISQLAEDRRLVRMDIVSPVIPADPSPVGEPQGEAADVSHLAPGQGLQAVRACDSDSHSGNVCGCANNCTALWDMHSWHFGQTLRREDMECSPSITRGTTTHCNDDVRGSWRAFCLSVRCPFNANA